MIPAPGGLYRILGRRALPGERKQCLVSGSTDC